MLVYLLDILPSLVGQAFLIRSYILVMNMLLLLLLPPLRPCIGFTLRITFNYILFDK
jgi:hypothetical protein